MFWPVQGSTTFVPLHFFGAFHLYWGLYTFHNLYLFEQGVCHIGALPFTLKRILRQKKNYGNSNISPCKNIILRKYFIINQNPSRYYNSITNLKFQHKTKYHISKILVKIDLLLRGQNPLSYYTL